MVCITAPAEIVIRPPNVTVEIGEGLTLACVAFGSPLPQITWYIDGFLLHNGSSNVLIYESLLQQGNLSFTQSILELCPVTLENAGEFSCRASNSHGDHTIVFQVMVTHGTLKFLALNRSEFESLIYQKAPFSLNSPWTLWLAYLRQSPSHVLLLETLFLASPGTRMACH